MKTGEEEQTNKNITRAERERLRRIAEFENFLAGDAPEPPGADGNAASTDTTATAGAEEQAPSERAAGKEKRRNIHAGHRKRVRESARRDKELNSFSDIEILEMLLAFGIPQKDTNPISHELLEKFGGLLEVFSAPYDELVAVRNMTASAAEIITMLGDICGWTGKRDVCIPGASAAATYFGAMLLAGDAAGGVLVAYLDGNFGLIALERLPELNVRVIIGCACKYSAAYVVVALRSGIFPEISKLAADVKTLSEALTYFDAKLIDCLVFTDFGYFSPIVVHSGEMPVFSFEPYRAFAGSPELAERALANEGGGEEQ